MGYFYLHTSFSEAKNFSVRRTVKWAIATFAHQLLWSIFFRRARRAIESLRETESGSPWWSRWLTGWSGWKRRHGGIPSWMKYFRFLIISSCLWSSRYQNLCLTDYKNPNSEKRWSRWELGRHNHSRGARGNLWNVWGEKKNPFRNNSNFLLFKNVNWTNKINNHCQSPE